MRLRHLFAAALALLPGAAWSAGFEIPDNGTQAMSRGGAFTAVASDGTAMEYNPAGFAKQSGLQLTIDLQSFKNDVTFSRTTADGTTDGVAIQKVSNSGGAFLAPLVAVSYGKSFLPLDRLTFAAGIYGPPAVGRYVYPTPDSNAAADAPNRYQLINNDIFVAYPNVSVAYKLPIPVVFAAIGVSGQMVISHFQFHQDIYAQPSLQFSGLPGKGGLGGTYRGAGQTADSCPEAGRANDPNCHHIPVGSQPTSLRFEDSAWDADVAVDVTGKKVFTAVLGALVKAGPVSIGASFRPGYSLHADGTLKVGLPNTLTADSVQNAPNGPSFAPVGLTSTAPHAQVDGDDATLDLKWPSVLRAGVDVDVPFVPGSLDVSADWTYETWGVVDQFTLTPKNISVVANGANGPTTLTLAPVIIPKHMQNTQSYRLGAQYELPVPVVIIQTRLGGYYEKSALPEDYTTIDLAQFDRVAITGGASVGINLGDIIGPVMLDLGALYSPAVTRNVRDSQVMLTTSDANIQGDSIGNGDYTSSVLVLSAGLRLHFGI